MHGPERSVKYNGLDNERAPYRRPMQHGRQGHPKQRLHVESLGMFHMRRARVRLQAVFLSPQFCLREVEKVPGKAGEQDGTGEPANEKPGR